MPSLDCTTVVHTFWKTPTKAPDQKQIGAFSHEQRSLCVKCSKMWSERLADALQIAERYLTGEISGLVKEFSSCSVKCVVISDESIDELQPQDTGQGETRGRIPNIHNAVFVSFWVFLFFCCKPAHKNLWVWASCRHSFLKGKNQVSHMLSWHFPCQSVICCANHNNFNLLVDNVLLSLPRWKQTSKLCKTREHLYRLWWAVCLTLSDHLNHFYTSFSWCGNARYNKQVAPLTTAEVLDYVLHLQVSWCHNLLTWLKCSVFSDVPALCLSLQPHYEHKSRIQFKRPCFTGNLSHYKG